MFNGGLRYAPEKSKNMKNLEFDYFNGEFSIKDTDFSEVKPFSHTNVVVNCDQPLCRTNGPLERNVADFISKTLGLKAKWDHFSEWTQSQRVEQHEFPRINKLEMGIDIDF